MSKFYFDSNLGNIRLGERLRNNKNKANIIVNENIFGSLELTNEEADIHQILSPIVPKNIICIGLNYRNHAKETNMPIPKYPVVFIKTHNTLQHPNKPIVIPRIASNPEEVDYECELAVIIGKRGKNIKVENALDHVLGIFYPFF